MLLTQIRHMINVFKNDKALHNFKIQNPKYLYNIVYFISLLITVILLPIPLTIIATILFLILDLMQIPITFLQSIIIIFSLDILKDIINHLFNIRKI